MNKARLGTKLARLEAEEAEDVKSNAMAYSDAIRNREILSISFNKTTYNPVGDPAGCDVLLPTAYMVSNPVAYGSPDNNTAGYLFKQETCAFVGDFTVAAADNSPVTDYSLAHYVLEIGVDVSIDYVLDTSTTITILDPNHPMFFPVMAGRVNGTHGIMSTTLEGGEAYEMVNTLGLVSFEMTAPGVFFEAADRQIAIGASTHINIPITIGKGCGGINDELQGAAALSMWILDPDNTPRGQYP